MGQRKKRRPQVSQDRLSITKVEPHKNDHLLATFYKDGHFAVFVRGTQLSASRHRRARRIEEIESYVDALKDARRS